MKLKSLLFLAIFAGTACFRAAGESAPVAALNAVPSPTPAKTAASDSETVPLLEMNIGGLLGGSRNGEWISAKETAIALKGGEQYKLYNLEAIEPTAARGESPTNGTPCEDFYSIPVDKKTALGGVAFGASLDWNPLIRPVKKIAADSDIYRKIAVEVLSGKGLAEHTPKIKQIYQADLDGDGTAEVVLSATSFKGGLSSRGSGGDYSFVLLRKVINGKAENFVLDGDFVKEKSNADAPAEYKISSIADLNGDGKMEIVIYARYYEGEWVEVFESKNDQPVEVEKLKIACGS
ncbi:MAG: VCBS repeat-containing protein [Acidobacteriota bacterium]|nr:VCBS repeat-containing protein [Acidobacteriota bacterium]